MMYDIHDAEINNIGINNTGINDTVMSHAERHLMVSYRTHI
jgi:hypothetical protein